MHAEAKKYFKYLDLVREDIREEFNLLDVSRNLARICDYGCGNGLSTFGLALETQGTEYIGIDLFNDDSTPTLEKLNQYLAIIEDECNRLSPHHNAIPESVCKLAHQKRLPQFTRGNIVFDHNLPGDIDLAYCKKVLVNLLGKEYKGTPSGEDGLRLGIKHITQNLAPGGLLCAVEYDKDFGLGKYLEMSKLHILKKVQLKRREIRSRGRTQVVSTFSLYLCQRP
jgi:SAM-dependent methyltransferase